MEASKKVLTNATARNLEDFKKWLSVYSFSSFHWLYAHHLQPDIDPVTAQTPFFAHENASKWAVLEQWHAYQMERCQHQENNTPLGLLGLLESAGLTGLTGASFKIL